MCVLSSDLLVGICSTVNKPNILLMILLIIEFSRYTCSIWTQKLRDEYAVFPAVVPLRCNHDVRARKMIPSVPIVFYFAEVRYQLVQQISPCCNTDKMIRFSNDLKIDQLRNSNLNHNKWMTNICIRGYSKMVTFMLTYTCATSLFSWDPSTSD